VVLVNVSRCRNGKAAEPWAEWRKAKTQKAKVLEVRREAHVVAVNMVSKKWE
jgi:hypothetical protein